MPCRTLCRRACLSALLTLSLGSPAAPARAAEEDAALRPREWTVDDVVLREDAEEWAISPDGRLAAWVKSSVEKVEEKEQRVTRLWLSRLDEAGTVQLTRGADEVSRPVFSPDGRHLAFLSDREPPPPAPKPKEKEKAGVQIWALALGGGEPFPVTRFDRPVKDFGWIDGDTLAAAAVESPSAWEHQRAEAKDDTVVVDDAEHEPAVRLFRVELDGEARRLTTDDDWIDTLAVSPDGRRAVAIAQQSLSYEFDQTTPPVARLVDLATGAATALEPGAGLLIRDPRWSADSAGFYFLNDYTRHPRYRMATVAELYYYDLTTKAARKVGVDWPRGIDGGYAPAGDGVIALLADGVRYRPAYLPRAGGRRDLAGTHARNVDELAVGRDGVTVVYRTSSLTTPPQWYVARLVGDRLTDERRLTELNARYAGKPTGRIEVAQWTGARGDTVEGIVQYPLDGSADNGPADNGPADGDRPPAHFSKRPLVLSIHGGPAAADRDSWDFDLYNSNLLWRQRGAFVLQVNYHGSSGYGLDWVESIAGHYYDLEVPDIEAGVDALIARGLVDPERLAVTGWSNGGILGTELITRNPRYRAASIGAADVEWISDWANVDFGAAFDNYYLGGPPWELVEVYLEKSPFFRLTDVVTPTLVHTGTEDRAVPPHQSWSLFRALQQIGKTDTRLVLYPGEPHGLRTIAHQRRKVEEDAAWLDRYLFAAAPAPAPEIPRGSRLAGLLERGGAARHDGRHGVAHGGKLIPETVPFRGLEVGRFEVTRAQWASYAGTPAPSDAERPASGLTAEEARAYVAWLADLTGRPFRLPTAAEAEALAAAAEERGNTLDYWLGYPPNFDDREAIARRLAELPGDAPLLLPVGSFPPVDGVFDLDGNVAEWTVQSGAGLKAVGPSAERAADPRAEPGAAPAYTGLRVVVGGGVQRE